MNKYNLLFLLVFCMPTLVFSQTVLEANGPGDTYELINSVLAPNYNVVEVPDCGHEDFGRHIDEVFDSELNKYVFRFHIHTSPDNDRCINFDRQRNEIKTYNQSPDSLLAVRYEKVEYKWKFKLDSNFQASSSFTHLHQIKAVGGPDASMPLFTLTARKSNPDRMELRHAEMLDAEMLHQAALDSMKGIWIEAQETILYEESGMGEYEILLTKIQNGDTLFHYSNNAIRTWKTDASFLRPKWGIYRSLNDSSNLRDEEVLFADFYINEIDPTTSLTDGLVEDDEILLYPNPSDDYLILSPKAMESFNNIRIYNTNGALMLNQKIESKNISVIELDEGLYIVELSDNRRKRFRMKIILE